MDTSTRRMELTEALKRFREVQPDYELLADYLQRRLGEMARALGMYPIVMARAKSLESFAEKIQRPGKSYGDPLLEMTDLCGVRVITHTLDEVRTLAARVTEEFLIDSLNSEDKSEKLAFKEFGYLSSHYIIQLKAEPEIPDCPVEQRRRLMGLKTELQLRTLAQHLWADVYHELGYKNEFQLPGKWEREFARLAAILENCDKGFQEVKTAMDEYQSSYGRYMTQEQLRALAERLEVLLEVDSKNIRAMHRLIRTYLGIEGADDRLRDVVRRYRDALQGYAPAVRDIGVALTQIHRKQPDTDPFREGQALLQQALALDPRNVDAWCSLAGSYRRQKKRDEAKRCYREAYNLEPTNPYPLGNYIVELLLGTGGTEVIQYFRPQIQAAALRCMRQVEVEVNLPWALFDLGLFRLYLGDPYAGLCAYVKGIDVAPRAWMVQTAAKTIADLKQKGILLDGLEWLDKLLCLGWWVRADEKERRESVGMVPNPEVQFVPPVLVLAGGCEGLDAAAAAQLDVLRACLAGVTGTVVGGGTRSGIAAIPGDLQAQADADVKVEKGRGGQLYTIGYVPAKEAARVSAQIDTRYRQHRHSGGNDFSPLEPLTFWEDYLAAGGDPAKVTLLGFNGGNIAACEFRTALAFGARVGIIAGSGRAADELLADPLWTEKDHPRLHRLSLEGDDVKQFLTR
jgi:ppGpp synthetase/RelA/SpoT-type nucleotidyltranferase